jgi:cytidylate kinase
MIIAIDGVAASGKGVLAEFLAKYYNCDFLLTGNLYRLCAKGLLKAKVDIDSFVQAPSQDKIIELLKDLDIADDDLGSDIISEAASKIAAVGVVRQALNDFQIDWIKKRKDAVVEGRDIGTVIWPQAEVKLFLTADPKVRAERRAHQLRHKGEIVDVEEIYTHLVERDKHDKTRSLAPMKMAEDAILLDTTDLTIEQVQQRAISLIEEKRGGIHRNVYRQQ